MTRVISVIFLVLCSVIVEGKNWEVDYDTDGDLNLNDLVKKMGLDGTESHYVTTQDGYIINVQRLKRENRENLMPIVYIHGLSGCADSFFVLKNQSSPMVFSYEGYDVWIMNSRGTLASSNHTVLNPDNDKEFWYFSWTEIGMYDLPATIDMVLQHNVHKKVILIGHSEGSTVIFVTLSTRPEYNDKVALGVHWGVAVYHNSNKCSTVPAIQVICKLLEPSMMDLADQIGFYSIRATRNFREMVVQMCRIKIFKPACFEIAKIATQDNGDRIKHVKDWSFILNKAMCGGSMMEFHHYIQVSLTGRFAKYDYGPKKNLEIYNSTIPPLFPLENVTAPQVIWCTTKDIFCTEADVVRLKSDLKNVKELYENFAGHEYFGHISYLVVKDVKKLLYKDMLALMKKYST